MYVQQVLNLRSHIHVRFTVKIRNLYDYQLRLLHGILPLPSGVDIANTIKYFSQTLLTVLKDVPNFQFDLLKNPEMDSVRMSLFPNLDYKGLYNSVMSLIEVASLIQYGLEAFGQAVLQCLGCLLPFLENDMICNIPYLTASSIAVLPSTLHQDIVNYLCFYILPFTITRHSNHDDDDIATCQSVAAVIMMIFQYSTNAAHHCQLLECLMNLKQNVLKDLLCVIAYGTPAARSSSAKLLFYYWPAFNANLFDRKGLICKFAGNSPPFVCQRDNCPNAGNAEAAKVCYDHCISITFACDSPPPLYLCIECANEIHREYPNQVFYDILHSMQQVSMVCENKNCRATERSAVSICFSTECASYNGNRPIRYCQQCHDNRHNNRRGGDHIVHKSLPPIWQMDTEMQTYMVEAIVSLLKGAKIPKIDSKESQLTEIRPQTPQSTSATLTSTSGPITSNITLEERHLLGRYGVWLLVGRCTPADRIPTEILGRLIAMLFHWFHVTAYSYNGQEERTLEKLKTEYVCDWLHDVRVTQYKLFLSSLLPYPPEYARVGGHWDTLASRTSHLKDGLHRLFCLVPYEIITPEIWDHIMPHWMDAVVSDVTEKELCELKIILSKILDTDMSPLAFDCKKMYHFISKCFKRPSARIQEQALQWLQMLSVLEITIPLQLLFTIFENGVQVLKNAENEDTVKNDGENNTDTIDESETASLSDGETILPQNATDNENDAERNLSCCILMLDILLKQMELQNSDKHTGINSNMCKNVCRLLKCMLTAAWISSHECGMKFECNYCEFTVMWHQLSLKLIKYLSPVMPAHLPDPPQSDDNTDGGAVSRKSPPDSEKKEISSKPDVVISMPIPEIHSVGGVLVHMPHVCSIMTATVETVSEQLDLSAIIPSEKVAQSSAIRSAIHSDSDAMEIAHDSKTHEEDGPIDADADDNSEDLWHTSHGKFRFTINQLPQHLQYIYQLLNELCNIKNPDTLYYMLQCLNILCLNGDAFSKAAKQHKGFFIYAQENLLIKNLWELCNAEHSHICEVTVPLLLHCITLTAGSDVFWRVIQEAFHSTDWRERFVAVERVTVIARFMDSTPLRTVLPLQAALANAFCYLISSIDDTNVYVAQRSTLYLGTIHDSAIKSLLHCLETQFDTVIVDRPMVLQSLYQLHNLLSDRKILTWEFFLNRFDTLFLEAQINLEKSGDISYLRDLRNTDLNSEVFIKKLHRAHEALSQSDGSGTSSVKTLSASFGTKWPYKRTMSAPASMIPRHDNIKPEKEKVYNRQYSAPVLKRKSSRFGLDGHIHSFSTLEDGNLIGFLHRVIDLEEADRETIHLLVFLLMQFLSRSDQAYPIDEKHSSKSQNIVLRHLYLLLGYNQNEKSLYISPQRLRMSPVFSAYISNLPQLLDQNHLMGWVLFNTSLGLLQYCPSPHIMPTNDHLQPTYSLWCLEPHTRRCWLMSLVVLLYKYQYTQQPHSQQLQALIRIVLNTLDAQHHRCRRLPTTIVMGSQPSRSRDVSQPSLGAENELVIDHMNTPPLSPMYPGSNGGQTCSQIAVNTKGGKVVYHQKPSLSSMALGMETHWEEDSEREPKGRRKIIDASMDVDESESDLIPIPESDLSDSTLQDDLFEEQIKDDLNDSDDNNKLFNQNSQKISTSERRPMWFIGNEEESLQTSNIKRRGIQEGMKMLVTSSLLPNSLISRNNLKQLSSLTPSSFAGAMATTLAAVSSMPVTTATAVPKTLALQMQNDPTQQTASKQNSVPVVNDNNGDSTSASESSAAYHCEGSLEVKIDEDARMKTLLSTPSVERLLPIGGQKSTSLKFSLNQMKRNATIRSPESPLSKMDILSLDSSKDYETDNNSPEHMSLNAEATHFNFPVQERLLPVGMQTKEISQIVEKVKQILGMSISDGENGKQTTESDSTVHENMKQKSQIINESVQSHSPRRLIKQVALESPPHIEEHSSFYRHVHSQNRKDNIQNQRQRMRKADHFTMSSSYSMSDLACRSWCGGLPFSTWLDGDTQNTYHANIDLKQSSFRVGDECVSNRCSDCGMVLEEYSDEEIGLCIIILGTFIHREPAVAAPFLPDILNIVAKVTVNAMYPWQNETNVHLPGGAISVAHQFLRCILHQLAPNGVFIQMFQTQATDTARMQFFRSVSQALLDFNELSPIAPLQLLLEYLNSKKTLSMNIVPVIFQNMACYLDCLSIEVGLGPTVTLWSGLLAQMEILFRRIIFFLNQLNDFVPLLRIMVAILKIPIVAQFKGILDPFSKVLAHAIQVQPIEYHYLIDLCSLCNRTFARERDKLILCRTTIFELIQVLKFKTLIPDSNLLKLITLILQDVGGAIPNNVILNDSFSFNSCEYMHGFSTTISECMRLHLNDILEFLTDFHALNKIKSFSKGLSPNVGLNDDTLGGIIKSSIAQYVALEITKSNGRDHRAVSKYFPWLCNTFSLQQGVREFLECIGHIRLLSWILLGSLTHTALYGNGSSGVGTGTSTAHIHLTTAAFVCQPIPQEASCQIADHIQVIMAVFAEQPKASVLHMSSLFHVFILCQLWTIYLEQGMSTSLPITENYTTTMNILFDFWGKVTPCVLQLISQSKMLNEMVSLHFLCMLEALIECRSTFLCKLLPLWTPILFSHHLQLPGHLQLRLQNCRNFPPQLNIQMLPNKYRQPVSNPILLRWLQRLQFKMGQIELQSSAATQFYSL